MRSSSVFSSLKTTLAAATLAVMLTAAADAAPAAGRESHNRGERLRREDPITRVIRIVKKFFTPSAQGETMTLPHPH
jgi:hypothetical protein